MGDGENMESKEKEIIEKLDKINRNLVKMAKMVWNIELEK
jgi:hypothetical protein